MKQGPSYWPIDVRPGGGQKFSPFFALSTFAWFFLRVDVATFISIEKNNTI